MREKVRKQLRNDENSARKFVRNARAVFIYYLK